MFMKNRIDILEGYLKDLVPQLSNIYEWKPNYQNLHLKLELSEEFDLLKGFEKEIELKKLVSNSLNHFKENKLIKEFNELSLWVIEEWGGITTGDKDKTSDLIKSKIFDIEHIEDDFIFDRISSISKVLAFLKTDKFVVYDSRVAYSINWILLKAGETNQFFPVPDGRNSKMMAFDINVLIRLKNIKEYQTTNMADISKKLFISQIDKKFYIEKNKAYADYVKLIRELNVRLFPDKANELFHTEMLLFSIADKQIYKDITDSISTKIN